MRPPQPAGDPLPARHRPHAPDLDALVLPSSANATLEPVDALSPLLGQHPERAVQTAIIVPELFDPATPHHPPHSPPAVLRRIAAAPWAHDPDAVFFTSDLNFAALGGAFACLTVEHVKAAVLAGSVIAACLAALLIKRRNGMYRRLSEEKERDDDHDGIPDVYQRIKATER